jgi:hypothetical protein
MPPKTTKLPVDDAVRPTSPASRKPRKKPSVDSKQPVDRVTEDVPATTQTVRKPKKKPSVDSKQPADSVPEDVPATATTTAPAVRKPRKKPSADSKLPADDTITITIKPTKKPSADSKQPADDTITIKPTKNPTRTRTTKGGDAPAPRRRIKASPIELLAQDATLTMALTQSRTIPTLTADTSKNVVTSVAVQLECDLFPAIAKLIPKNVERTYMSTHYVHFTIANTHATTCNFIRQQCMATPTIRLYAAYSDTAGVDHSKLQLTCKYCPFWQYIVDNIKLIPIFQKVSTDSKFSLHVENKTDTQLMIYSTDIVRVGGNMFPINKYPICEISPQSALHIDNICPITNTNAVHASHSNVAHVRVKNKVETNELIDDNGTFDISFKLLEGIMPVDFIKSMFASIHAQFVTIYNYLDAGQDGIILCQTHSGNYQYTIRFAEPLMCIQYIVRIAQDAGHTIGTTMNPDDVCVTAYTDDMLPILKHSCQIAIHTMAHIEQGLLSHMR